MWRKLQWFALLYVVLFFAPFFVPGLNQLDPHLGPVPMTIWFPSALLLVHCILVYIWSVKVWDPMDKGLEATDDADGQVRKEDAQ